MNKIFLSSILAIILLSSVFTINSVFGADDKRATDKKAADKKAADKKAADTRAAILADAKKATDANKATNAKKAEQAKKMAPKMFLVYANNLDSSYKLTESNLNYNPQPEKYILNVMNEFSSKTGKVLLMVILYRSNLDAIAGRDVTSMVDQSVFSISKEDKCVFYPTISSIACISGHYEFVAISPTSDDSFKFMDIMLKKYYKAQGKVFKESTKQLSEKATLVPAKEKTYDEKINSLFDVEIIDCGPSASGAYVAWKGSITSHVSEKVNVKMILTGNDLNGNIVTFAERYVMDLYPEQTQYISGLLEDVPKFDSCGYKIESLH